ncbi:extracellular solute-binding protein [Marinicrinis lubricantis]|uniref:Extracellular solute-binding protein n=1 Tax=Marinicrinis lubricantis TaxID=2086470 RepID=A0ABW1IVL4_9BACL
MFRKTFRLICLILIPLTFIMGCSIGGGDKQKEEKITLTLWYWNRSIDDDLLKRVEDQFPHIDLRAEKIGGDFKAKLMSAFAARSGAPDIVGLNDWVADFFPNKEQFYNLYDLGSKEIEPLYLDWKWQQGVTPDGYQIALPMDTGPTALFYREDIFREVGLPTDPAEVSSLLATWEDYIDAGIKIRDATNGEVYLVDNLKNVFTQMLGQGTRIFFNTSDEFIGDQEHVKRAWDTAAKMNEEDLSAGVDSWSTEWNGAMNNGDVATFIGAVWAKQILMDAAPNSAGQWRIAKAPGGNGNNGGSFIAIPKQSKHPEEAFEVIKWLMNPENQLNSLVTYNLFPSTPSIFDDPKMSQPEPFFGDQKTNEYFIESALNIQAAYFGPKHSIARSIFDQGIDSMDKQNASPDKAWKDALERIEKELLLY